ACVSLKLQREPVVWVFADVVQQVESTVVGVDYGVKSAVIIDIADGHSPCYEALLKDLPCCSGHILEFFSKIACNKGRLFVAQMREVELDVVHNVGLVDEQILVTIVIEVGEVHSPPGVKKRHAANAGCVTGVIESTVALVLVHRIFLIGEIGNHQI